MYIYIHTCAYLHNLVMYYIYIINILSRHYLDYTYIFKYIYAEIDGNNISCIYIHREIKEMYTYIYS